MWICEYWIKVLVIYDSQTDERNLYSKQPVGCQWIFNNKCVFHLRIVNRVWFRSISVIDHIYMVKLIIAFYRQPENNNFICYGLIFYSFWVIWLSLLY